MVRLTSLAAVLVCVLLTVPVTGAEDDSALADFAGEWKCGDVEKLTIDKNGKGELRLSSLFAGGSSKELPPGPYQIDLSLKDGLAYSSITLAPEPEGKKKKKKFKDNDVVGLLKGASWKFTLNKDLRILLMEVDWGSLKIEFLRGTHLRTLFTEGSKVPRGYAERGTGVLKSAPGKGFRLAIEVYTPDFIPQKGMAAEEKEVPRVVTLPDDAPGGRRTQIQYLIDQAHWQENVLALSRKERQQFRDKLELLRKALPPYQGMPIGKKGPAKEGKAPTAPAPVKVLKEVLELRAAVNLKVFLAGKPSSADKLEAGQNVYFTQELHPKHRVTSINVLIASKKDEDLASAYLRSAKKVIDAGKKEEAKKRLQEIISKFPGTKACAEAKKLLEDTQ